MEYDIWMDARGYVTVITATYHDRKKANKIGLLPVYQDAPTDKFAYKLIVLLCEEIAPYTYRYNMPTIGTGINRIVDAFREAARNFNTYLSNEEEPKPIEVLEERANMSKLEMLHYGGTVMEWKEKFR